MSNNNQTHSDKKAKSSMHKASQEVNKFETAVNFACALLRSGLRNPEDLAVKSMEFTKVMYAEAERNTDV